MADEEAEQAYFQTPATDADAGEQGADNGDSDDYDPSETLQDQQPPATESDAQPDDDAPSMTISADSNAVQQPGDALSPSQTPSRAESQTSTPIPPSGEPAEPKTRMIGGFVVEDDDDDEDDKGDAEYEPPGVLGAEDTNAMPVTMSEEPSSGNANQTTSSPDVSSSAAPASVHEVANSSSHFSVPVSSNTDPAAPVAAQWAPSQDSLAPSLQNSTVPTPVPDSPSASRARLPHDRVGILQDRIDEDPRGDIAAWLELIAEHRSRNRLDSAREVYERFLKVFPMAVGCLQPFCNCEYR
jgi:cleavage stimulation factor subunit 3